MGKAKPAAAAALSEQTPGNNVTPITQGRKPRAAGAEVANEKPSSGAAPAIVVFGKDEAGKAHASWFAETDAELAIVAAGMMGYHVLRVTSPAIGAKAQEAAQGRIFASGKGFVPFCKTGLYEALCGFDGAFQPPAPAEREAVATPAITGTPQQWQDIQVGSLVLASVAEDEGWFESVVIEARGDDLFVLRWQGWPDEAEFARQRDGLALLPVPR